MKNSFTKYFFLSFLLFTISNSTFSQQLIWKSLNGPMGGIVGDMVLSFKDHIYVYTYSVCINYSIFLKSTVKVIV